MVWTGTWKDEDFKSKWGNNGKTAKMKIMQDCSKKGYQTVRIHDRGGWRFQGQCKERVTAGWSRPFSDEAAQEEGYKNRDDAGHNDCKKKGYAGKSRAIGRQEWNYQFKCQNPGWEGGWSKKHCVRPGLQVYEIKVKANGMHWETAADWLIKNKIRVGSTHDGGIVKKVYPRKVIGSGMFVRMEVETKKECQPKWKGGWSKKHCVKAGLQVYEIQVDARGMDWEASAKYMLKLIRVGSKHDGGIVKKVYPHKVQHGHGAGMYVRMEVETKKDCQPKWLTKRDGRCDKDRIMEYQKCDNWVNNDPKSCELAKPAGTIEWQKCAIGSSPDGREPGHTAKACSGRTKNFSCVTGQNCYAITKNQKDKKCDPTKFTGPFTKCDGNDKITFYSCDKWLDNNPGACKTSLNKPKGVVDYKMCALGSSPEGVVPNKGGIACPVRAGQNCMIGQECFPVVKREKDEAKCVEKNFKISGPFDWIMEKLKSVGIMAIGVPVMSSICSCLILILLMFM